MLGITDAGGVEVLVAPATVAPRRNPKKRSRLITEHKKRQGDPALGGSTRAPIMTAYRQQALACAAMLVVGPRKVRELTPDYPDAQKILHRNVYGWFEKSRARHLRAHRCRLRGAETLAATPTGYRPAIRFVVKLLTKLFLVFREQVCMAALSR